MTEWRNSLIHVRIGLNLIRVFINDVLYFERRLKTSNQTSLLAFFEKPVATKCNRNVITEID